MDPRRLLPAILVLTVCAVLATGGLLAIRHRTMPDGTAIGGSTSPTRKTGESGPRTVLADWDQRRADAWSSGDVGALRRLYVAGSATGRVDVRMLTDYVARGLTVDGLHTQVLALTVVEDSAARLRIRVTDRVVGGAVTGQAAAGQQTRQSLPRDRPTTRTLTLRQVQGEWLMVRVRDQANPAASTSRTSSSSKS